MLKHHLTRLSGLDPDCKAFDPETLELLTYCGRYTAPLDEQPINLTATPSETTCGACQRTKDFKRLISVYGNHGLGRRNL
ncbi:hypothetical protein SPB21_22530 [Leptothoe sp. ISB3NOV94-8A]